MGKATEALFKVHYAEILAMVERRRHSWILTSIVEWQDVSSIVMTRIWKNFGKYDPTQPLDKWVNTVTTNALKNLGRQHLYKHARPCVSASGAYGTPCVFNRGGNACSKTPSKIQCAECPLFAKWQAKKEAQFNVSTPLSLENHTDESKNRINDTVDISAAKTVIDAKIMASLDRREARLYRYLYIKNLTPEQAGKKMRFKLQKNSKIPGYLIIRKFEEKVVELAKEIIAAEGLA